MSFLSRLLGDAKGAFAKYAGDTAFLTATASAVALVIAADGKFEESEISKGIEGLSKNPALQSAFSTSEIESAITTALGHAQTRAGRAQLKRALEAMLARPSQTKEDIFYIAADTADVGAIGAEEQAVLEDIAKTLGGIDAKKLLAA